MDHRFEILVDADITLAVAATEHAIQVRRPVVLVPAVEVDDVVAEIGDLLRDGELRFAAPQCFLGIASDGDVADETDEPRRLHALHAADGELCRKFAPVASLCEELTSDADDAGFARLDVPTQIVVVLGPIRLGKQDVHLEPDDLFLVVAEHALARVVEQLDAALVIEEHDRVHGRVEHSLEFALETLRPFFLGFGNSQQGHGGILARESGQW